MSPRKKTKHPINISLLVTVLHISAQSSTHVSLLFIENLPCSLFMAKTSMFIHLLWQSKPSRLNVQLSNHSNGTHNYRHLYTLGQQHATNAFPLPSMCWMCKIRYTAVCVLIVFPWIKAEWGQCHTDRSRWWKSLQLGLDYKIGHSVHLTCLNQCSRFGRSKHLTRLNSPCLNMLSCKVLKLSLSWLVDNIRIAVFEVVRCSQRNCQSLMKQTTTEPPISVKIIWFLAC